jgi:FtsZ-binding cell division protein ZapB
MKLPSNIKANEYADNVPLKTMIKYGYDHDDKWVQRMAEIIELCTDNIRDGSRIEDIGGYLEEYSNELNEALSAAEYAEEERKEVEREAHKWRERYQATKYDEDSTLRVTVEEALKSQVYSLLSKLKEERKEMERLREDYADLRKEHDFLQEKHNTWTVLAT